MRFSDKNSSGFGVAYLFHKVVVEADLIVFPPPPPFFFFRKFCNFHKNFVINKFDEIDKINTDNWKIAKKQLLTTDPLDDFRYI